MPFKKPRYEFIDALTVASAGAYEILDDQYNPDVVFWEATLENGFFEEPGELIVAIIAECGLQKYLEMRERIAGVKILEKAA